MKGRRTVDDCVGGTSECYYYCPVLDAGQAIVDDCMVLGCVDDYSS